MSTPDFPDSPLLTARQLEVLELLSKGLLNREIAGALGIAPATVKRHVSAVIAALDVTNRTEAATRLHELGLGRSGEQVRSGVDPRSVEVSGFGSRPAIAVLPFDCFSKDPEHEFLADAFVEDLITRLAGWRWFPVIARNSTFTYKGKAADVMQVSRDLGARYLIEGSLRVVGEQLRITVQLVDGTDGRHLWAHRVDGARSALFDVEDEIVDSLVATLEPALMKVEGLRVRARRPESLDAWECVRRGFALCHEHTMVGWERSKTLFERAAALDPTLSTAHSFHAFATMQLVAWGRVPSTAAAFQEMDASARRAYALDPNDPMAQVMLGWSLLWAGRRAEALVHYEQATLLDPSFPWAHNALSTAYLANSRPQEGLASADRAIRLSPQDPELNYSRWARGMCLLRLNRVPEAEAELRESIRLGPDMAHSYVVLAPLLVGRGEMEEARRFVRKIKQIAPGLSLRSIGFLMGEKQVEAVMRLLEKAGWSEPKPRP